MSKFLFTYLLYLLLFLTLASVEGAPNQLSNEGLLPLPQLDLHRSSRPDLMQPQIVPTGGAKRAVDASGQHSATSRGTARTADDFTASFQAGQLDEKRQFMGGTELIAMVAYKGKLYAANGYWEDLLGTNPNPGPQLLVSDSPGGQWRQEHAFSAKLPNGLPRFVRVTALKVVTFTTDGQGHALPQPVSMLVVGLDGRGMRGGAVFTQNGDTGEWTEMDLGMVRSFRALAFYKDPVTGVDRFFAGGGGREDDSLSGGIFSGVYDPTVPGRIRWDKAPEFTGFKNRVMAFVECNGRLYFAAKPKLYERITNGPTPEWREVYSYEHPMSPNNSGLRGLTAITNPEGPGQVILGALEGRGAQMVRIDPTTGSVKTELDIGQFLREQWGSLPIPYVIAAYNDMPLVKEPLTNRFVHLIGLQAHSPLPGKENSAWYLVRDSAARYSLHEIKPIPNPTLGVNPKLVAVRTIIESPFAGEAGQVLYFGGYDCNGRSAHNTAWLYQVGLRPALSRREPSSPMATHD